MRIEGVITAMVTPFGPDGEVDLEAARGLARHLIENGSHGVVVAGTTGEAPTLSDEERLHLLAAVREEIGGPATVIAGVGTNDTRHSVEQARDAHLLEPDAMLLTTPYYNKPNQAGLRAHFEAIAEVTGEIPLILYNIPSRSVINMPPEFLADLAATIPSVAAVKQANDDDLGHIDGLDLLAGNDTVFARCLALGGTGGILVASHLVGPEMRRIYDSAVGGDSEGAASIDAGLQAIYAALAVAPSPIPVKAALDMLGIAGGELRLPMVPASQSERAAIRTALERHGLMVAGGAAQ